MTTETTTKGEARPWGAIRHRKGAFYVAFTAGGRKYERGPITTWKVADGLRNRARALIEAGTPVAEVLSACFGDFHGSRLSFREAAPLYLVDATGDKKASTLAVDTVRLNAMSGAPWAGKPLALVRTAELKAWASKRRADGASCATVNRDLSLGSALYRWAIEHEYVEDNPFRRFKRYSEKGRERETYLTAAECRALTVAASPTFRPILAAALATGARRGELLALRWRDVDLARREIVIRPESEKAGRGRVVPMTDDLKAVLEDAKARRSTPALDSSDPVFVLGDGSALKRTVLALLLDSAVMAAGDKIPAEKQTKVTFHCLRHTAASIMVGAGVPILDVARILGHSTLAMTMRYAHFAPESGRKAIDALGDALAGRAKAEDKASGDTRTGTK